MNTERTVLYLKCRQDHSEGEIFDLPLLVNSQREIVGIICPVCGLTTEAHSEDMITADPLLVEGYWEIANQFADGIYLVHDNYMICGRCNCESGNEYTGSEGIANGTHWVEIRRQAFQHIHPGQIEVVYSDLNRLGWKY